MPDKIGDRFERWASSRSNVLSFVAAAGSLLSGLGLLFAIHQIGETRKASDAAAYAQIAQSWHEHLELFLEYPEVKPFIYGSQKIPNDPIKLAKIEAMVDLHLDAMDRVLTTASIAEWNEDDIQSWKQVFKRQLSNSASLCAALKAAPKDYPELSKLTPACMP